MPRVFYSVLKEKHNEEYAADSIEAVNYRAGQLGYQRLSSRAQRTDTARNNIVKGFMEYSSEPDDMLIMLDQDHIHPMNVLERLASHKLPVVSALAFRRGPPYFPCIFFRKPDGTLAHPRGWKPGVYRVDATGTAAIAVQRHVFKTLESRRLPAPWFQYTYPPGKINPSEDMYFSRCCELAAVPVYCDFTLITPHITIGTIQDDTWYAWLKDNPDGGEYADKLIDEPYKGRLLNE